MEKIILLSFFLMFLSYQKFWYCWSLLLNGERWITCLVTKMAWPYFVLSYTGKFFSYLYGFHLPNIKNVDVLNSALYPNLTFLLYVLWHKKWQCFLLHLMSCQILWPFILLPAYVTCDPVFQSVNQQPKNENSGITTFFRFKYGKF